MARPGSGGSRSSGGGGGGHRISSSGSGHRVSSSRSSSRSSSSFSSSSRRSSSSRSGNTFINIGSNNRSYGGRNTYGSGGFGSGYRGSNGGMSYGSSPRRSGFSDLVITIVVVIFFITFVMQILALGVSGIPKSTVNREKLNVGGFSTDCIVDNEGWFDNLSRAESRLKGFFNKTGVQPYIVINSYNPELVTDADMANYAKTYYDSQIGVSNGFMYMYFPEEDPNADGYMHVIVGTGAGTVMDAEAQDIFWSYIDYYWFEDMSVDDIFVSIFDDTADRIMTKSKTMADVLITFVVGICIIGVLIFVVKMYKAVSARKHQEALDTERILNADLDTLSNEDDEMSKYD